MSFRDFISCFFLFVGTVPPPGTVLHTLCKLDVRFSVVESNIFSSNMYVVSPLSSEVELFRCEHCTPFCKQFKDNLSSGILTKLDECMVSCVYHDRNTRNMSLPIGSSTVTDSAVFRGDLVCHSIGTDGRPLWVGPYDFRSKKFTRVVSTGGCRSVPLRVIDHSGILFMFTRGINLLVDVVAHVVSIIVVNVFLAVFSVIENVIDTVFVIFSFSLFMNLVLIMCCLRMVTDGPFFVIYSIVALLLMIKL